jgi:hypothetical protein
MRNWLLIFFLLLGLNAFNQSKPDLLNHLYNNHLYREFEYVLQNDTIGLKLDSLSYFKILNHFRKNQESGILENFELAKKLIISDTNFYLKLNLHFLQKNDSIKNLWFYEKLHLFNDTISKQFKNFASILLNDKSVDTNLIPNELRNTYFEFYRFNTKKPFFSAFYATLIPGLGKLYNGRKYSFRNVFFAHVLLGSKFVESIYVLGLYNPYTFVTFGFLSTYYLANIVGSYFDLKEVKKEKLTQFILNVKDYYLSNSTY